MTSDHVGRLYSAVRLVSAWVFLLLRISVPLVIPGTVGAFGWGGAYIYHLWVDPVKS
jgi:hypothetical protein